MIPTTKTRNTSNVSMFYQRATDVLVLGLLALIVIALAATAWEAMKPRPAAAAPTLEAFTYQPGSFLGCDVGPGADFDSLQMMTRNIR